MSQQHTYRRKETLKDGFLVTKAGSKLKPLGFSAWVDSVWVETEDGYKTTVQFSALEDNEVLQDLLAQAAATTESAALPTAPLPA